MKDQKIELTLNSTSLTFLYKFLFFTPVAAYLIINFYQTGFDKIRDDFVGTSSLHFIAILAIMFVTHELLHIVGGVFAGARIRSFDFGFDKLSLSITCGCNDKMSVRGFRSFLLLPFIVLTPILIVLAYIDSTFPWWLMLAFSSSGCAFDLTVFTGSLGIPSKIEIIPELIGENGHVYLKGAQ